MTAAGAPLEPLSIAAQGSFAVGGTFVSRGGAFDPAHPMDPASQTRCTATMRG